MLQTIKSGYLPSQRAHAHDNGEHRQGRAVKSLSARDQGTSDNAGPAVSQPPRPPAAPGPPPDVLLIVYICFIVRDSQCLLTERSSKGQCINGAQSFSRV